MEWKWNNDTDGKDFPTLREIKDDFHNLIQIVGNVTTVEQAKRIAEQYKITVEINGFILDEWFNGMKLIDGSRVELHNGKEDIEWIRYENYGCLDYIYCFIENGKITRVVFDVWSNKLEYDFLDSVTIGDVDDAYRDYFAD